ncbi:MAG: winged helix-turn-helix domain-containing protein [Candidatus Krumholzibacteriota bacterium]
MRDQSKSIDRLLARRAGEAFVGRDEDLAHLHKLLDGAEPLVVFLHGIPGVGKSSLVMKFAEQAGDKGAQVLVMDGRLVEPTERGFLSELGRLTGDAAASLDDAVGILGKTDATVILAVDHYDSFLLMDTWLRGVFLPAMPDNVRLLMAGRRPPVTQWLTSPDWYGLVHARPVEPLDRADGMELLTAAGLDSAAADQLAAVTHGNPMALKLAASSARVHGAEAFRERAIQEVMQQLAAMFLDDVADPSLRDALRFASVARRITRSLLRAFSLGDEKLFDALRELPIVDIRRDGLCLHETVREAMARTLKANDPEQYYACRRRVWRQLRREVSAAPVADIWRYTADMIYLIENPVVREAFFPSGNLEFAVEAARAEDAKAVQAIAARHDGPDGAAALEAWWTFRPDAFRVVRDREDSVVGFYCMSEAADLPAALLRKDPVAKSWSRHLAEEPIPAGSKCLFIRRWLADRDGEIPSAEQAACWLDMKRTYMELRPALRRAYLTVADLGPYAEVATRLGFRILEDCAAKLGSTSFPAAMLDFGPASVDGWITGLVGEELGVQEGGLLDRDRRALVLDGEEVPLTPLEYGLMEYLEALGGATASRDDILEAVWDSDGAHVGSNVVDAVVKTLRRKLGAEEARIETVRGFGYRWRRN